MSPALSSCKELRSNELEKPRAIKEVQGISNTKYMATQTTTIARNRIQKKRKLGENEAATESKIKALRHDDETKKKLIQE